MPTYSFKARDPSGAMVSGTRSGASQDEVASELSTQGYIPVTVTPWRQKTAYRLFIRVSQNDLIVFSHQLATLIRAGVSFMRALDTLSSQTTNRKLRDIIDEVKADVEGGATFASALGRFPQVFPTLYTSMIYVGEEAGVLDEMLERLAVLLEHDAVTRQRIKTAVRYPIIVLAAMTAAFFFLTAFVVPRFAALYSQVKATLPMPTRVLIWLNTAITQYWWAGIIGAVLVVLGIRYLLKTPTGRWHYDRLKLKVPLVGPIVEKAIMSRFARIFGTLYRSGIPVLNGLDVVTGTLGNVLIVRAVNVIKESVREGKGIAVPMESTGVFPPMVVQMTAVGEETGELDNMLYKVADYYDSEVEYGIRNLSTSLEPVLLAVLAMAILFLALGIFLPMWDMIRAVRGG